MDLGRVGFDCTPRDLFEFDHEADGNIAKRQKKALENFIGTLEYKKRFDPAELDSDLAKKIMIFLIPGISRVP